MSKVVDVEVKLASELPLDRRPTVSLCYAGLPRAVDPLLTSASPHVDEVVATLVDCDPPRGRSYASELLHLSEPKPTTVLTVDWNSHPNLYQWDLPSTFAVGQPLAGEVYPGPHTGRPFVSDWASLRNLGLRKCTQEWVLLGLLGEKISDLERTVGLCDHLDHQHRDVAYTSLRTSRSSERICHSPRLVRNLPALRFEGSAAESLEGGIRPGLVDGCLAATYDRSNDLTVLRVLYSEARREGWQDVPPANLLHMARAAWHAVGPEWLTFCDAAIKLYLDYSLYPEERAWACAIAGEISESRELLPEAAEWYQRSIDESPCWKSYYRLARVAARRKQWQACLDAYDRGLELGDQIPIVDDGAANSQATLVHVAVALHELGRRTECRQACDNLQKVFPSEAVRSLCSQLE